VIYALSEYAQTAVDMLARRTRLAFLNVRAAEESLPRIIELMSRELGWSKQREQVRTETCDDGCDNVDMVTTLTFSASSKRLHHTCCPHANNIEYIDCMHAGACQSPKSAPSCSRSGGASALGDPVQPEITAESRGKVSYRINVDVDFLVYSVIDI